MAHSLNRMFLLHLLVFITTFVISTLFLLLDENGWLFSLSISVLFGAIIGCVLLAGIGRKYLSNRYTLPIVLFIGITAYPGHFIARYIVILLTSTLIRERIEYFPSRSELVIEFIIMNAYWIVLPFVIGRIIRKIVNKNT